MNKDSVSIHLMDESYKTIGFSRFSSGFELKINIKMDSILAGVKNFKDF